MTVTLRKRGSAPRQSKGGLITNDGINIVYRHLRDSLEVKYPDGPLPEIDGPASILPRSRKVSGGDHPLPDSTDVRATLVRALATIHARAGKYRELRSLESALRRHLVKCMSLHSAFGYGRRGRGAPQHQVRVRKGLARSLLALDGMRSKGPELLYVRLALQRHLELGLTADQAFGYMRPSRGAPPHPEEHKLLIAYEMFERRFITGVGAEFAAEQVGGRFGIDAPQVLEIFSEYSVPALERHKAERLRNTYPQLVDRYAAGEALSAEELEILTSRRLWSEVEEDRLKRYYDHERHNRELQKFLAQEERENSGTAKR